MKDNIININLETSTAPTVQEVRGRDWIEYGTEDWRNLYPQFLIDLYYSSSITAAIVNSSAEMIAGEDLIIEDEEDRDLEARVKLQNFMDRANSNESLHEVIKKLSFDFKLQGGFALNIVWSKDRTQIAEVYHVDVSKLRCARPDEFGKTPGYYISADWSNTRQNKPYYVPAFNANDRTSANQIMYSGLYSPNMNSYFTPDYVSCNNWALIDGRISEYHLNAISNGFSGSFMISFANGIPTAEERNQIEQSLTDKFCSETNAGKFVLTFSDDKTRTPEITPITPSDLDKQYLALQELLTSNILSGHRVTSKTLMGIDTANGFSSNTDEIINAANFYLNTVIKPFQDQLVKQLRKIFQINLMDMPVNFVQLKPITVQFDSKTIREVMTQDEIREELGLEPLGDEEVVSDETIDFSKVGMVDGKPVFSTIEEAEAHAKTLGCEGYHEHNLDGTTAYMACQDHSEATELSKFIEEFGEDIPEDWEIVDEENVNDEHEDFDFEAELNKLAEGKTELASTGTARPNQRSTQDGVNDSYNDYFKVRYMYTKDNALSQEGETREFCKLMTSARKVYRKEDLLQLTKKPVNPGWGPRGAATYSIWLYKGGGNCHHYFRRVVYKTSLRNAKSNINSKQIISDVKAISEGFTLRRNSGLVAKAPKRMKNNGFLNPR
jgi:hypothetical protein|tara:strand:- start:2946 stop:4943 length:1998 start_codon:yes stop_codon:yes gene_type:complete